MPPRFGTDGLRGVANTELTPEIALALGRAAARVLPGAGFLVGRDTRLSGPMLQAALSAGLAAEGRDVVDAGVIPTPGLALLASQREQPAAMISASHNPFADNGIKLLGPGGTKLSLETEVAVQGELEAILAGSPEPGTSVGQVTSDASSVAEYTAWLAGVAAGSVWPEGEVVVDCANGAASAVAPSLFTQLGVEHSILGASPTGRNINANCGSTHLELLAGSVISRGAALGIAFDGDADRMLAVDHAGGVVDGDHLIAMFARDLRAAGRLKGETVVVTVMSNLGLRLALADAGIAVVETPVGDRHVADALDTGGFVLGGEQSGHVIFGEHASTGDGILTALKLLDLVGRSGLLLAELAARAMVRLPQVLINVPVPGGFSLDEATAVRTEAEAVSAELGGTGRVLLRASGTESCVRVMVEAPSHDDAVAFAERIAERVRAQLT